MTDDTPYESALELADRLVDEFGAFLEANEMTAAEIGEALGLLMGIGSELLDCPGCWQKYIEALKTHIAHLDEAEVPAEGHVH
jgi:predicted XRE-type DNA-binding protein